MMGHDLTDHHWSLAGYLEHGGFYFIFFERKEGRQYKPQSFRAFWWEPRLDVFDARLSTFLSFWSVCDAKKIGILIRRTLNWEYN